MERIVDSEYRFRIAGSYTPATLPMDRLAEYMAALATLLGEGTSVHFRAVENGSAVLVADVDDPARPKVRDRVRAVRDGGGPKDALKAFHTLDELLRKDNATGALADETGAVVIPFPGHTRPEPVVYGPFRQDGTLDGQVIRVGGRDETVPVHLRDGAVIHIGLYADPELARRIAQHFLGPTLRLHGTGTWFRAGDGTWELKGFKIASFDVLDETPLVEVVGALREAEGNRWGEVPDPVRALLEQRHADGDAH
jgi:hypothetical protein